MEKEYINIGKIDTKKFIELCSEISTEEVILTKERLEHIKEKHKEDLKLCFNKLDYIIKEPDYILEEVKNELTAMIIKHIENTNINVILKLAMKNDNIHTKNSIMTLYRIRDKNLEKLIKKNKIIYKKE